MEELERLLADLQAGTIETTEALYERIAALTDEEVAALEQQGVEMVTAIANGEAELEDGANRIEVLNTLADAVEGARYEAGGRYATAEAEQAEVDAVLQRVAGETTPDGGEGGDEAEGDTPPATPTEEEAPAETSPAETPPAEETPAEQPPAQAEAEPVAAAAAPAGTRLARAAVRMPAERRPQPSRSGNVAIVAAGDLRNHSAGARIADMEALTSAIFDRAEDFRHLGRGKQSARVASIEADYPEEQDLRRVQSDAHAVEQVVTAALGASGERILAMAAAGGFCAPAVTLYDLPTVRSSDARPGKGALPSFQATRGRVTWMPAPRWTDYSEGVSFWTADDDVDALTDAEVRKPCVRVDCDDAQTAEVYAIPMCVTVGNFFDRTYPERRDGILEGLLAWQSRVAERRLLFNLGAASTDVSAGKVLGTARDVVAALNRARAGFAGRWRVDDNYRLEWWAPRWLRLQMVVDLARSLSGGTHEESVAVASATVDRIIAAAGVNVTWLWEAEEGGGAAAQEMSNYEVDGGSLDGWPDTAVTYLFPPGVHTFLDAGRIDLGVVRDSTLNAANDLQIWSEGFEGHMYRGPESLRLTLDVCPTGEVGATAEIADLICTTGS